MNKKIGLFYYGIFGALSESWEVFGLLTPNWPDVLIENVIKIFLLLFAVILLVFYELLCMLITSRQYNLFSFIS